MESAAGVHSDGGDASAGVAAHQGAGACSPAGAHGCNQLQHGGLAAMSGHRPRLHLPAVPGRPQP